MTFVVEEHVEGVLTVLRVGSRSRPGMVHYVTVEYDEQARVVALSCSCESGEIRENCHHLKDLRDLMGKGEQEIVHANADAETGRDRGGSEDEHPPQQ